MRGYTLIELLVVLTIMSIIGVVGYVNYKQFAANQVTDKAVGVVQTLLRLAQSNATTSTLCNNQAAASWLLVFTSGTNIELRCDPGNFLHMTYTLENAEVDRIGGTGCSMLGPPFTITYSAGTGSLSFSPSNLCLDNASSLEVTVKNSQNPEVSRKTLNLSKGGAINVE